MESFSLSQVESNTFRDRGLADPRHSQHCGETVLEDYTNYFLHLLLPADELANLGHLERVRWFCFDQRVFSLLEGTKNAALVLKHLLLNFLLRLKIGS